MGFDLDTWTRSADYRERFARDVRIMFAARRDLFAIVTVAVTMLWRPDVSLISGPGSYADPAEEVDTGRLGRHRTAVAVAVTSRNGPALLLRFGARRAGGRLVWQEYEVHAGKVASVRGVAFGVVPLPDWPALR